MEEKLWLNWAIELQSLAQAGLTYGKDVYDRERYERIREISAEIIAHKSEIPVETVKDLFCNETGYQTPKLDTRAAVFNGGKILLVRENNGKWSLPGGWVDVNQYCGGVNWYSSCASGSQRFRRLELSEFGCTIGTFKRAPEVSVPCNF